LHEIKAFDGCAERGCRTCRSGTRDCEAGTFLECALVIASTGRTLYAGTYGGGVYDFRFAR
jgi:hypothetical protein